MIAKYQPTRRIGRPPTGKTEAVLVRLDPDQLAALDAWIDSQPSPRPTRPAAIRSLMQSALSKIG